MRVFDELEGLAAELEADESHFDVAQPIPFPRGGHGDPDLWEMEAMGCLQPRHSGRRGESRHDPPLRHPTSWTLPGLDGKCLRRRYVGDH